MDKISLNKLFGCEFEIISAGYADGQYNMDFDLDRTHACSEGKSPAMFRLYGWNPWAVSLGANQDENEIDKDRCNNMGFGLVRRPTGGRAVLHANELTYAVVMPLPNGWTVHDAYREIHNILMAGFHRLNIEGLDFCKSQPDFKELYKRADLSVSCFASSARYEIGWNGKKIVGSAQRLFGKTLLQHGSILLGPGHEQIAMVTKTYNEDKRNILLEYISSHAATLSEAAGRGIAYNECEAAVFDAIIE